MERGIGALLRSLVVRGVEARAVDRLTWAFCSGAADRFISEPGDIEQGGRLSERRASSIAIDRRLDAC
jgi:hypothetical protein